MVIHDYKLPYINPLKLVAII